MNASAHSAVGLKAGGLRAALASKASRITHLFQEIAGLGVPAFMKPEKFKKFLMLLAQVDAEREKEEDLLLRIEEIESLHRDLRQKGKLEHAAKVMSCANDNGSEGLLARLKVCFKPYDCKN